MGNTLWDQGKKALEDDAPYFSGNKTIRELWGLQRDSPPSAFCRAQADDLPMYCVNWSEGVAFCDKVSQNGRLSLRLPTEAEWEFACRAGGKTAVPGVGEFSILGTHNFPALDGIAWYGGNSSWRYKGEGWDTKHWPEKQYPGGIAGPRCVGTKQANAWGLYDMIGNVWEWCSDYYAAYGGDAVDPPGPEKGSFRVGRGGCWRSNARGCRSADRGRNSPGFRYGCLGFRVALSPSSLR